MASWSTMPNSGLEGMEEEKGQGGDLGTGDDMVDLSTCSAKTSGRSLVWIEGLFVLDPNRQPVCTTCRKKVPAGNGKTSSNTTNLLAHYSSPKTSDDHRKKLHQAKQRYSKKQKTSLRVTASTPSVPRGQDTVDTPKVNRTVPTGRIFDDLVNWMIMAQQPVRAPEHPLLRRALKAATGNPGFEYGGREKFKAAVIKKQEAATDSLKDMLKGTRPAITIDTWSSNSNVGFIALTVHYMETSNDKWVLKKGTCACEVFDESHSSERLGAKLMAMLKDLGIETSVVSVTSDTTANLRDAIEKHTPESIEWIGCLAHKMGRTVQEYLLDPGLMKTLDVFEKAAAHLQKVPSSQQAFEAAQLARFPMKQPTRLPLAYPRHWWSYCGVLKVATDNRSSLVSAIEIANDHPDGPGIVITDDDWKNAREMSRMLEPFHSAMKSLQGDDITMPLMPCLMGVLDAHVQGEMAFVRGISPNAASEINLESDSDRWDEVPDAAKMASCLSPRTKGLDWLNDLERETWHNLVLVKCEELLRADMARESADREREAATASGADASSERYTEDVEHEQPTKKRKTSWVTMFMKKNRSIGDASKSHEEDRGDAGSSGTSNDHGPPRLLLQKRMDMARNELSRLVADGSIDDEETGDADLAWWCQHQYAYPILARVAAIYLAIPTISAASERVFSSAGSTVSEKRNGLEDDVVDSLVFLHGSHGLAWDTGLSRAELSEY